MRRKKIKEKGKGKGKGKKENRKEQESALRTFLHQYPKRTITSYAIFSKKKLSQTDPQYPKSQCNHH
jgi:hypothetical protein